MFGIGVKFLRDGVWSKAYTYKSTVEIPIGDRVVVPTNSWHSVGKVTACVPDFAFKEGVNYKSVEFALGK